MGEINEIISQIKVEEDIKEYIADVEQNYFEYLQLLTSYGEDFVKKFLHVYKDQEYMFSNQMEGDSNLASMFRIHLSRYDDSIKRAVDLIRRDYAISAKDLHGIHKRVMRGEQREYIVKGRYRDNQAHVGYFTTNEQGERVGHIVYTPPPPEQVPEMMQEVLDFYNSCTDINEQLDHPFLQAAVTHALILHVQPYMDGNSRTARVLQHAKLWQHAYELHGINLISPALYLSGQYSMSRKSYRGKVDLIDQNPFDSEAWNQWLNYSLSLMYSTLVHISEEIKTLKAMYDNSHRR